MLKRIIVFPLRKLFRFYKEYKFYVQTGIYAEGINYTDLQTIALGGKNSIGKNCKIITEKEGRSKPALIIKKDSWIGNNVEINTPSYGQVQIGTKSSIQDGGKILGDVYIGDFTLFAPNVFVSSGNHHAFHRPHLPIREQDKFFIGANSTPIYIEDDCWIGKNAFIKPGTYIGKGSIIGLGAMVKGNIPPYSVIIDKSKILKKRLDFTPSNKVVAEEESIPYFYRGFNPSLKDVEKGCFFADQEGLLVFSINEPPKKITFKGTLVNSNANQTEEIDFYINGNSLGKSTVNQGDFELTIPIPPTAINQNFSFKRNPEQLKEYTIVYFNKKSSNSKVGLKSAIIQ